MTITQMNFFSRLNFDLFCFEKFVILIIYQGNPIFNTIIFCLQLSDSRQPISQRL